MVGSQSFPASVYTIPVTSLGVNQCYVQIVCDFKCIKVIHYCTHAKLESIIYYTHDNLVDSADGSAKLVLEVKVEYNTDTHI